MIQVSTWQPWTSRLACRSFTSDAKVADAACNARVTSGPDRYRFLEIYYRRGESTHKGRVVPARVETVVLFLPDVWSCVPTRLEWDGLHVNYKRQLERKLKADQDGADGANADEKAQPPYTKPSFCIFFVETFLFFLCSCSRFIVECNCVCVRVCMDVYVRMRVCERKWFVAASLFMVIKICSLCWQAVVESIFENLGQWD